MLQRPRTPTQAISTDARQRQRPRRGALWVYTLAGVSVALTTGCKSLDSFDTTPGEAYCGQIVAGQFVRAGFASDLGLRLSLDIDRLQSRPGALSSDDADSGPCAPNALFESAPLRASEPLLADPLSLLEFGLGREYNFFAWVDSSCQGPMLAVVSLMQSNKVEMRLLKPGSLNDTDDESGFGVFLLEPMPLEDCAPTSE